MNFINKIIQLINWLNGKKTTIGCIILVIATAMTQITQAAGVSSALLTQIISVLNYVGLAIGGTGLGHKGYKSTTGTAGVIPTVAAKS